MWTLDTHLRSVRDAKAFNLKSGKGIKRFEEVIYFIFKSYEGKHPFISTLGRLVDNIIFHM